MSLDEYVGALYTVREIQADPGKTPTPRQIDKLDTHLEGVSFPALHTATSIDPFSVEFASAVTYADTLRNSVETYRQGYRWRASQQLHSEVPKGVGEDLSTLHRIHGCLPEDTLWHDAPPQAAARFEAPASATASAPSGEPSPSAKKGSRASSTSNSRTSRMKPENLQPGLSASFMPGWRTLLALACLVGISLMLVRRPRKRKAAERVERYICNRLIKVKVGRRKTVMRIVDITQHGIKLKHNGLITRQRPVSFDVRGTHIQARVRWFNNVFAGVKFVRPLTEEQLLTITGRSKLQPAPKPKQDVPDAA
ncbi:MAG: hypothetical protein WA989_08545 [Henriciella sp.]|uniref:hypothetical protein n=1 Tax=Henriciella sp. TaxID=1968823 RepID=UPI003C7347F5